MEVAEQDVIAVKSIKTRANKSGKGGKKRGRKTHKGGKRSGRKRTRKH